MPTSSVKSGPGTTSSPTCRRPAASTGVQKPWVAIGAHYDHLGHGENGNSLAEKADAGKIHHGADDNASGTAAVLAVGEKLASQPRTRNVMLQFWSGEELGLIGSSAFVNAPAVPLDQLAAYVNFDMVGRMQDNKLTVQATGSSPRVGAADRTGQHRRGIRSVRCSRIRISRPTSRASTRPACRASNLFTGTHTDYHKPSDTADKIDYEDLDRIVDFAAAIVATASATRRTRRSSRRSSRVPTPAAARGVRLFTGTIPDYSTEVKGLLLSGVIGGGPGRAGGPAEG